MWRTFCDWTPCEQHEYPVRRNTRQKAPSVLLEEFDLLPSFYVHWTAPLPLFGEFEHALSQDVGWLAREIPVEKFLWDYAGWTVLLVLMLRWKGQSHCGGC